MLRNTLSFCLVAVLAGSLIGCGKQACAPAPSCYSGTVVGFNCGNGFLVQVDAQYPIGAPFRVAAADSLYPRPNVIAAVNQLGRLGTTGQRLYFTYVDDPNQQNPAWPCNAQYAWPRYPVPHLVLRNVSAEPCAADSIE